MRPPEFDRDGADLAEEMIPCLSVRQPYAWLISHCIKPVENRTWSTKFRGRVLIHAGVTYSKRDHLDDLESWRHLGYPEDRESMVGGIVGEAVITDCVKQHPSEYFFGPYGFVLDQAKAFERLIPYGGRLGFFGVPSSVLAGVSHKVAYVKSQGQTRKHHCHWPGCTAQCPPAMWGCTRHWYALPKDLRDRIWRTYVPGQEVKGTPSAAYLEAAQAVQAWILHHLANTPAPATTPQQEGLF
ncbi:ASCH domain-containing protein [Paucibacter sp. R3-3]|uniref:ASCH domain-containing protein n=1 Tax=Roseateles agri TaxID=3098619 RepID=A0ABU5DM10_9BURK|nr:ASCH domain-containing protein [Paucibacter sp. R3-3]MDY0747332.1 ASCH domain-containing protein [Paucibacter sp. R3-3]